MDLEKAHKFCSEHEGLIRKSSKVGCFYCGEIFPPSEIKEWIPHNPENKRYKGKSRTALCPYCRIDTVLPENCGFDITSDFLNEMSRYWFIELYNYNAKSHRIFSHNR